MLVESREKYSSQHFRLMAFLIFPDICATDEDAMFSEAELLVFSSPIQS